MIIVCYRCKKCGNSVGCLNGVFDRIRVKYYFMVGIKVGSYSCKWFKYVFISWFIKFVC